MMKTTLATAWLLFVSVMAASAQQQTTDSRWTPWLGCWQLVDESQRDTNPSPAQALGAPAARAAANGVSVCVTPLSAPAGVSLQTLVNSQPALDQTLVADGADHPVTDADCRGTQRAEWSRTGTRLLARAQLVCADQMARTVSGLAMIAGNGVWVDVQVVEIDGRESIRVRRYRRAPNQPGISAVRSGAPLTMDEVKEASGKLSPSAVEAALIATNAHFDLNSRRLIDLDDAGVPDRVIDVMVALSYPARFVVERSNAGGTGMFVGPFGDYYFGSGYGSLTYSAYLDDPYYYSPFGYSYWGRGGVYFLPGTGVATGGGGGSATPATENGGRAINGVGYARVRPRESIAAETAGRARESGNTTNNRPSPSGGDSTSSGSSSTTSNESSGGVTSGGFSSGSSSGDTGRTAQPR